MRAAVLGCPISHSLSPVLHNAGYAALGLDWSYGAFEVDKPDLASFVDSCGPEWAGLSLTMPLKEVALPVATEVSELAQLLGAANTLVLRDGRRYADNTDAPGMVSALQDVDCFQVRDVAILGAGGTAKAALSAAYVLGARVTVFARREQAAVDSLLPLASRMGVPMVTGSWEEVREAASADVIISTVPKGTAGLDNFQLRPETVVFDVLYDPWPTPLAASALRAGCQVVSGLDLLAAQAYGQFQLFTGLPAPREQMRTALDAAVLARG